MTWRILGNRTAYLLLLASVAWPSSVAAQAGPAEAPASADAASQAPEAPARPGLPARLWAALRDEAKRYGRDSVALVKAPFSWNKRDWKRPAASSSSSGA